MINLLKQTYIVTLVDNNCSEEVIYSRLLIQCVHIIVFILLQSFAYGQENRG